MKEGDANTKYFHLKACGRRKKNRISVPLKDGVPVTGDEDLLRHLTEFYKELFSPLEISSIKFDGIVCNQLSGADREFLTSPFKR